MNVLAWVNVPECLAAFLENKNEEFVVKGRKLDKFWFVIIGGKDAAYIKHGSGIQGSPVNRREVLENEGGEQEHMKAVWWSG